MSRKPRTDPAAKSSRTSAAAVVLSALGLLAAAILWQPRPVSAQGGPPPSSPAFYTQRIQPIFQNNCYRCHGGFNHRGGLKLDSRAGILHGGRYGAALVPGHPEQSLLIRLIRHEGPQQDPGPMPPKNKLSDADIAAVTEWIRAGAPMP